MEAEQAEDLETRVKQFRSMSLPGQPMGMHMGTAYLINDLWSEIERLREIKNKSMRCMVGLACSINTLPHHMQKELEEIDDTPLDLLYEITEVDRVQF